MKHALAQFFRFDRYFREHDKGSLRRGAAVAVALLALTVAATVEAQEKFNLFTRAAAPGCATGSLLYVSATPTVGCLATIGVGHGGTGTATAFTLGSVVFAGSSGVYAQDNANVFFDATNHRLGLGTTSPNALLDVRGVMRLGGDSNNNYPSLDSPTLFLASSTTNVLAYLSATSAGGNGAQVVMQGDGPGGALTSGMWLGLIGFRGKDNVGFPTNSSGRIIAEATESFLSTAHGTRLLFQTTPNGSTTAATGAWLENNGNFGIGGAPSYRLHVQTSVANDQAVRGVNGATTGTNFGIVGVTNGSGATKNVGLFGFASGATTNLGLNVTKPDAAGNSWGVYVEATAQNYFAGNVGIGVTVPAQKLSVAGTIEITSGSGGAYKFADGTTQSTASGTDTLHVIKETIFAGLTPASYSNGSTTTIDGCGYTCTVAGNGAVDIVATGLRLRQGTTSGSNFQIMSVAPGNTGDLLTLLGEARWRRGRWAFWTRLASYDYTNTSGQVLGVIGELAQVTGTKWAISHRRNRNAQNAPNTTTGGIAFDFWWNGTDVNPNSYPGVGTPDVMCTYVRSPDQVDIYYGTYSGGWPTLESMTLWGTVRMGAATQFVTVNPLLNAISLRFYLGGSAASSGTYELIVDRWRLTTWD